MMGRAGSVSHTACSPSTGETPLQGEGTSRTSQKTHCDGGVNCESIREFPKANVGYKRKLKTSEVNDADPETADD